PPPTHISPLSLHDALPISSVPPSKPAKWLHLARLVSPIRVPWHSISITNIRCAPLTCFSFFAKLGNISARNAPCLVADGAVMKRSEEHTSELQSRFDLVCR